MELLVSGFALVVLTACNASPDSMSEAHGLPPAVVTQVQPSASAAVETQAPIKGRETDVPTRPVLMPDASATVTSVSPKLEPPPLELIGTTISGRTTFAVIKEADRSVRTVRQGESVDGYIIGAIASDHVEITLPGHGEHVLSLSTASDASAESTQAPAPVANTALITEGINTDQSPPQNVTYVPIAKLPEGMKQIGH